MAIKQHEISALKKDVKKIQHILENQAEDLVSNGHDNVSAISMDNVKEMARHAGESARSFYDHSKEQFGEAKVKCEDTIRKRPFTSTAVALAGGIIIGSLLRRK